MSGTDIRYAAMTRHGRLHLEASRQEEGPLSSYALATPCPVLTKRMVLSPYAMSGTDLAISLRHVRSAYAMSGTDLADTAVRDHRQVDARGPGRQG
eukprot:420355-Rhodomonas_salina.5